MDSEGGYRGIQVEDGTGPLRAAVTDSLDSLYLPGDCPLLMTELAMATLVSMPSDVLVRSTTLGAQARATFVIHCCKPARLPSSDSHLTPRDQVGLPLVQLATNDRRRARTSAYLAASSQ